MLGLFGICLVILSVSSSVGLFSALGVRVAPIIAEVILFLVLAVGVDNVFILVHELDRQNLQHGPNAASPEQGFLYHTPVSPTSRRSRFDSSYTESVDAASLPQARPSLQSHVRVLDKRGSPILIP